MAMIQNQPVEVMWGGFRSNTHRLGQEGWEIAIEQQHFDLSARLFMKHKEFNMYAFGLVKNLPPVNITRDYGRYSPPHCYISDAGMLDQMIRTMPHIDSVSLYRVETVPTFVSDEICKVRHLPWFQKVFVEQPETEELIVDPQCVQSMLDQILKIQGPMRKDIRARDARRDRDEPQPVQVHARIISFKQAA